MVAHKVSKSFNDMVKGMKHHKTGTDIPKQVKKMFFKDSQGNNIHFDEKSTSERIGDMTSQYGQTIQLGNLVFAPMSTGDMSGYIGYECVLRGVYITLFPPKVNEEEFDEWEIYVDGEATTLGSTLNVEEVKRFIIEKVPDEVEHMEEDWGDGWDSLWESRRH